MPKVLLAFDFGMKKIGAAVGQTITRSATPLANIPAKDGIPNWKDIQSLIDTWQADALVVGLPYNMDGSTQAITYAAKKFGNRLHHYFHQPVFFVDERLTTVEARSQLGHPSAHVDSYAAKLILETWFREQYHEKN